MASNTKRHSNNSSEAAKRTSTASFTTHQESGIRNDPNDWAAEVGNPHYIFDLLLSIISISVQTVDFVASLPKLKSYLRPPLGLSTERYLATQSTIQSAFGNVR
jgi:hypothetical protein